MNQLKEHNGWTNYPTWAAYTWLSNDIESYHEALSRSADELQTWFDNMTDYIGPSLESDLLGFASSFINWDEVAAAFQE